MKVFIAALAIHFTCLLVCSSELCAGDTVRQQITAWAQEGREALANHQSNRALESYQKALKLATLQNDFLAAAALQNLIGEVHEGAARYQKALFYYERAAEELSRERTDADTIAVDAVLVELRSGEKGFDASSGPPVSTDLYRGEIPDLVLLFKQPKPAAKASLLVASIMNIANMYLQQSQFHLVEPRDQEALRLARQNRFALQEQQILTNLAWSALKNGNFELAAARLDSVLATVSTASPPVELRRAFLAVGVYFSKQKKYTEAVTNLERTLPLYRAAQDERGYCRALAALATTQVQAGELEKAVNRYREALAANQAVQDQETYWEAHGGLAKCYHELGNLEQALQHYEQYWAIIEQIGGSFDYDQAKVNFLENQDQIVEDYCRVALQLAQQRNDFAPARAVIEKVRARALTSLQSASLDTPLRAPLRPAGQLSAEDVLFGGEMWRPSPNATPDMAVQRAVGVESPFDLNQGQELTPEQRKMAAGVPSLNEALAGYAAIDTSRLPKLTFLEYYVLAEQTAILVKSTNGEIHGAMTGLGTDSLATLVTDYGRALEVQTPRGLAFSRNVIPLPSRTDQKPRQSETQISRQLYQALIAPVTSYLPSDPQDAIVIVPHRALWLLPFAALQDEAGHFFSDQHVLTYAASHDSWQITASRPRPADQHNVRAWVVGNPRMPESAEACGLTLHMQPLPGAQREAEAIAHLLGPQRAELFVGDRADRLRLEAWHANYSVLHFATHGFACVKDALSSFIVLSGLQGKEMIFDAASAQLALRAEPHRLPVTLEHAQEAGLPAALASFSYPGLLEARTIINRQRFHLNADLVTLSACQTGLGQLLGEGTIGLSRAFLAAGARSIMVSLWRVDDQATKDLMIAFYQEYLRHGNKGRALQRAMHQTRQRYPQPKFWAAFTLMGMAE